MASVVSASAFLPHPPQHPPSFGWSSVSMGAADKLSDLQLEAGYSGHAAYSLSKLCDAMLSQEMHARYGAPPKLTFNTMDPTAQCGCGCDTKMLRAGWGNWGAPPSQSTTGIPWRGPTDRRTPFIPKLTLARWVVRS